MTHRGFEDHLWHSSSRNFRGFGFRCPTNGVSGDSSNPTAWASPRQVLHELLFAVSGYDSDVFVRSDDRKTCAMPAHFPDVTSSERESLNRLAALGALFYQLAEFCDKAPVPIIVRAFQLAIQRHVSDPYRNLVVQLETQILNPLDHEMNGLETGSSMLIVAFEKV